MDTFTIAAAARLCHCDRRTLQRAIHAGRLHLDAQHCLSREALIAAGYLVVDTPQETPQEAPRTLPQATPLVAPLPPLLEHLATAIIELAQEVRQLRADLHRMPQVSPQSMPQSTPHARPHATPHTTPQETPRDRRPPSSFTPQAAPQPPRRSATQVPAFDTSKFVLGTLCPRGHDYYGTGQTLRRVRRHVCPACDVERTREQRQTKRQTPRA